MKDNSEFKTGPLGNPDGQKTNGSSPGASQPSASAPRPQTQGSKLDFWVTMDILANRWHWLAVGAILCAGGFFYLGSNLIKEKFTASAQLRRNETPEFFKSAPTTPETFVALIRSPDLMREVGEAANPPISPEDLAKSIKVDPAPDSDMVKVLLVARDPQTAVALLNAYLDHAVEFTKQLQTSQFARLSNDYLKQQVVRMDEDITALQKQFRGLPASPELSKKLDEVSGDINTIGHNLAASRSQSLLVGKLTEQLNTKLLELNELSLKFTDIYPSVVHQKEEIAEIQKRIFAVTNGVTNLQFSSAAVVPAGPRTPGGALDPEADIIRMKLLSLEEARVQLAKSQQEAELYAAKPPGMATVFERAIGKTVKSNMRWVKVSIASIFGGLLGIMVSFALVALVELTDTRLRTSDDLKRVTQLPVLTTLGDLKRMDDAARAQWAFRAWTMLQGRLSPSANHGLVCGITSSAAREGRSTWISLLAEAASLTGFRVLTIATKPSPVEEERRAALADKTAESAVAQPPANEPPGAQTGPHEPTIASVGAIALKTPSHVTDQLTGPNSQPVVHIPLPGWVWNLERRKEWREALVHWRQIDNLVILVELPPADVPEAVLLGSNLPNLVWLADSGAAHAGETRAQLATLRDARCNLVGAVLNREPSIPIKSRFPRWLGCVAVSFALGMTAQGQDSVAPAPETAAPNAADAPSVAREPVTNRSFSVVHRSQRASWQEHLTLGPGDVLNLGLYGQPELARAEVSIGPDGRIGYLEAQDVLASGLTVDELRAKFDEEIGKYRRTPRTLITPIAFRSKRYYMLGKVMTKGVYVLDRPLTVLEALARAHGLENGLVNRNVVDLADFQRSFLARGGKRFPLNFEKLFQEGDLSQNIPIEPGDYIFFSAAAVKEVYVVGEVRLPGTVIYNPETTIMAAISARGGYTDRAYKTRVLVVRGSLNDPEAFAVNTHAILDGKALDFKLQPRDIIYVNSRPFIKVEELLDTAATAFIQSLITSYVGVNVVKPIR